MTDESQAVLILIRLGKVIELALAENELTVNQFRLLTFARHGASDLRSIAVRLAMKPSNASVLIDGLVRRGLIDRRRNSTDGRRFELHLTAAGRSGLRQAEQRCAKSLAHIAAAPGSPPDLVDGLGGWAIGLDDAAVTLQHELDSGRSGLNAPGPR